MFGLAGLAMPMISNLLGGALGGLFGGQGSQGAHGCHHHHHHHHHNNVDRAQHDFRMAQEDFRESRQDFQRGDIFGGLEARAEGQQHMADGYAELSRGNGGWI